MMQQMKRFGRATALLRDRRAAVAVIFALALIPMIGIAAVGVEYAGRVMTQAKLDSAADAAVLGAIISAKKEIVDNNIPVDSPLLGSVKSRAQDYAERLFRGGAGPRADVLAVKTEVQVDGLTISAQLNFSARSPQLARWLFPDMLLNYVGSAKSTLTMPLYRNLYFLLDVSASMAVGATAEDQVRAFNDPNIGCTFTCHHCSSYLKGQTKLYQKDGCTVENNTTYSYAKRNGILTRFDVLQNSMRDMLTFANSVGAFNGGRLKIGLYTFGNDLAVNLPITQTSSPSDYNTVLTAVNALSLRRKFSGTNFRYAFKQMNELLPSSGTGLRPDSPLVSLIVVTDGVEDFRNSELAKWVNGVWTDVDDPNAYAADPIPVFFNPRQGSQIKYTHQALNPDVCRQFTTSVKNIDLWMLNVEYMVNTTVDETYYAKSPWYDVSGRYNNSAPVTTVTGTVIAPFNKTSLGRCPKEADHFVSAITPQEISEAIRRIFANIVQSPRLTR